MKRPLIFDGKNFANQILSDLSLRMIQLKKMGQKTISLAIIYFEGDLSAQSFAQAKSRACEKIGMSPLLMRMPLSESENRVSNRIGRVVQDKNVTAITLVKPLPKNFNSEKLESLIPPSKDAEGLSPFHFGRLFAAKNFDATQKKSLIIPATALAIAEILRKSSKSLAGKKAVILGRSNILGNPAAHLLTMMDLTVTVCHSKTKNLSQEIRQADVLVSGMGHPCFIKGSWLKKGVIIIDAGTSVASGKIYGDVDFNSALKRAAFITPVPGGVGPVTTAFLLRNVIALVEKNREFFKGVSFPKETTNPARHG